MLMSEGVHDLICKYTRRLSGIFVGHSHSLESSKRLIRPRTTSTSTPYPYCLIQKSHASGVDSRVLSFKAIQVMDVLSGAVHADAGLDSRESMSILVGAKLGLTQPRALPSRSSRNITADTPWPCICRRQKQGPKWLGRGTCLTGRRGTSDCRGARGAGAPKEKTGWARKP